MICKMSAKTSQLRRLQSNKKTQSTKYFKVPKDVRLNSTHFFIMKIPNKRGL